MNDQRHQRFTNSCFLLTLIGLLLSVTAIPTVAQTAGNAPALKPRQKIVVHLSSSEGEHALHSAFMALGMATVLKKMGAEVTVMLDSSAPNLVRKEWSGKTLEEPVMPGKPPAPTLGGQFAAFLQMGGKILMCPHCTMSCGVKADGMIPGAKTAEPGGLAKLVFDANKIVDY